MTALLEAHGLSKHFAIRGAGLFARQIATLRAVDEVSLTIEAGRCLALVGESGCGKTSLARCLALLHRPSAGSISFDGEVVYDDKLNNYKAIRRDIQMVFQDPYGALNPRMTVAAIIAEPLNIHSVGDRGERAARVVDGREMPDVNVQYLAAVMLIDGTVGFTASHDHGRMGEPGILALRRRMKLVPDNRLGRRPELRQAIVEIALQSGRQGRRRTNAVRGTTANPMTLAEVEAKAAELMAPVIGAGAAKKVIRGVRRMERARSLAALVALMQGK